MHKRLSFSIQKVLLFLFFGTFFLSQVAFQSKDVVTIPLTFDSQGHAYVEIKINGKGPHKFGIDTGCTITTLSTAMARELGVQKGGGLKVSLGKVTVENDPFQISDSYGGASMIGYNVMKEWVVSFDYSKKEVRFQKQFEVKEDKKKKKSIASSPIAFLTQTDKMRSGIFTVQIKVDGKGPYAFICDTGAPFNILHPNLAKQLGIKGKQATVNLAIGEHELKGQSCSIQVPKAAQSLKWDGLLGYPFIKEFITTIDYPNKKAYFEKAK